jgi:hypothetical protein
MTNLKFQIVAEDASPPRLILHHANSSPPEGLTREQTTAPSSTTSTSGKAESNGTSLAQAEASGTGGEGTFSYLSIWFPVSTSLLSDSRAQSYTVHSVVCPGQYYVRGMVV